MKFLLTSAFLISFALLSAQFSTPSILIQELNMSSLKMGDLDNDGDLDFIGVLSSDLVWLENTGDGRHSLNTTVIAADRNSAYQILDYNEDGNLDIIINDYDFFILLGRGDGTFEPEIEVSVYPVATDVSNFVYADVNNDAFPDLLFYDSSEDAIFYIPITENHTTGEVTLLKENLNNTAQYRFQDINGDGYQDLIEANFEGFGWYLGANEMFEDEQSTSFALNEFLVSSLAFGDVDNDDDTDVIFIGGDTRSLRWVENLDNAGAYSSPVLILNDAPTFSPVSIAIEAVNGDAYADIILNQSSSQGLVWIKGLGDGVFEQSVQPIATGSSTFPVQLVDINNDSYTDIVRMLTSHPGIDFYLGGPDEEFSERLSFSVSIEGDIMLEDIDMDGFGDIISSNYWLKNDGSSQFFLGGYFSASSDCCGIVRRLFDSDGDGDLDILMQEEEAGIFLVENLGPENGFAEPEQLSTLIFENDLAVLDVDNDGDDDIITIWYNQRLYFYENDGGTFTQQQLDIPGTGLYSEIKVVDLDGDEYQDIVALDDYELRYVSFKNENGSLNPTPEYITPVLSINDRGRIQFYDFNLDGKKDLFYISSGTEDYGLQWMPNDGTGNFDNSEILIEEQFIATYNLVDIDGDFDIDILIDGFGFTNLRSRAYLNVQNDYSTVIELVEDSPVAGLGFSLGSVTNNGFSDIVFRDQGQDAILWIDNFWNSRRINGQVYFDENENGIKDPQEVGLPNQTLEVLPVSLTSWSNAAGEYNFAVSPGAYQVSWRSVFPWQLTTDSIVNVAINEDDDVDVAFGLKLQQDYLYSTNLSVSSAPTRCGFEVPFWITASNNGVAEATTELTFVMDDLTTLVDADPLPTAIVEDTLVWALTDFGSAATTIIRLTLQMPGVDFIGENLDFSATLAQADESTQEILSTITEEYTSVLSCAYDPNDKQVEPNIPGYDNYTLMGDTLVYTIRFQNLGNDTAINIRVEDLLDEKLDVSTLKPLASSHNYRLEIDSLRKLSCYFDNIYLPPAVTNEPASHGFIQFQVEANDMTDELESIRNSAAIFFDFNPPIITNQTENVMVTAFPINHTIATPSCFAAEDGGIMLDFNSDQFNYYWNNQAGPSFLNNASAGTYDLEIYAPSGELVFSETIAVDAPEELIVEAEVSAEVNTSANGAIELNVNGGTAPYSFEWEADPANNTNSLMGLSAGVYLVTVTDQNDCSLSTSFMVDQMVATSEIYDTDKITLSPNPATDQVMLSCKNGIDYDQIVVFSMDNRLWANFDKTFSDIENIDVSGWPSGVFLLVIINEGAIISRKRLIKVD